LSLGFLPLAAQPILINDRALRQHRRWPRFLRQVDELFNY
jgi:hypothetical protein